MSLNAEQLTRAITTMRAAVAVLNQVYTRDGTVADPGEVGRLRVALAGDADTLEIYSGLSSITIPVDAQPDKPAEGFFDCVVRDQYRVGVYVVAPAETLVADGVLP